RRLKDLEVDINLESFGMPLSKRASFRPRSCTSVRSSQRNEYNSAILVTEDDVPPMYFRYVLPACIDDLPAIFSLGERRCPQELVICDFLVGVAQINPVESYWRRNPLDPKLSVVMAYSKSSGEASVPKFRCRCADPS